MVLSRGKITIFIIIIFAAIFFAGSFDFPNYWNKAAEKFKFTVFGVKFGMPNFPDVPFHLGLDLQGGTHLVYQADLSDIEEGDWGQSLQGLRDVIERRVNLFGVAEPVVQVEDSSKRLIVELAGIKDIKEAIRMIGQTPFLEFKEERPSDETQRILDKQKELEGKQMEEIEKIPDWQLGFEDPYFKPTKLTGKYLKKSQVEFDPQTNKPEIGIEFNDEGAQIFKELTEKNVGKRIAIAIDNALISAPTVNEAISGGKAQITGSFTIKEARELSRNLNAGALPVPIKLISQQTVGPVLGEISLKDSLRAGISGFLAILLFLIIFYRISGFFSAISLIGYVIFILAILKIVSVTLTLAGIAGVILSMGMAVDANILIFSRMREELKQGKSYLASIDQGFHRAWPAVRDGNFTTILVGLILFGFGTSFVKGFALTLILGNLISIFTAVFITRALLNLFPKEKSKKWLWLWI